MRRLVASVEVDAARQPQQEGKGVLGAVGRVDALGVGQDHVALDKGWIELVLDARAGRLEPAQAGEVRPQRLGQRAVQDLGIRAFGGQLFLGVDPDDRVLTRGLANHVQQVLVDARDGTREWGYRRRFSLHLTFLNEVPGTARQSVAFKCLAPGQGSLCRWDHRSTNGYKRQLSNGPGPHPAPPAWRSLPRAPHADEYIDRRTGERQECAPAILSIFARCFFPSAMLEWRQGFSQATLEARSLR